MRGQVVRKENDCAGVKLDIGPTDLLHSFNCWDKEMPNEGDEALAKVLDIDYEYLGGLIGFKPKGDITRHFVNF